MKIIRNILFLVFISITTLCLGDTDSKQSVRDTARGVSVEVEKGSLEINMICTKADSNVYDELTRLVKTALKFSEDKHKPAMNMVRLAVKKFMEKPLMQSVGKNSKSSLKVNWGKDYNFDIVCRIGGKIFTFKGQTSFADRSNAVSEGRMTIQAETPDSKPVAYLFTATEDENSEDMVGKFRKEVVGKIK